MPNVETADTQHCKIAGTERRTQSSKYRSTKYRKVVGAERRTLATKLAKRYANGESVRKLAASTSMSYGFVHKLLTEHGVRFREPRPAATEEALSSNSR